MANIFSNAPNPSRLLVIAHDDFIQSITTLVDHKNRTGMPTHLINLSQIVDGIVDVSQHPWALKKVIAEAHKLYGTYYVLLVGDTSKIPSKHRYVRQPNGGMNSGLDGTYNPTDNYYANLYWPEGEVVSNWDGNNDGKYNESLWPASPANYNPDKVDGYPHVAVGRIPAHTVTDVINYVSKVIEYENGQRMRSINAVSFLSGSNADLPPLNASDVCDKMISDSKINSVQNADIQKHEGSVPDGNPVSPGWSLFNMGNAEIKTFTSKWMIHVGHGDTNGWTVYRSGGVSINNTYVKEKIIDSYSFPIVLSAGCDTGQLMPNAPEHPYRGLNPDTVHWFWYYEELKKAEELILKPDRYYLGANAITPGEMPEMREDAIEIRPLTFPIKVPIPHPYDFPTLAGRNFAYSWLCNNRSKGAIAYCGATVVHQGTTYDTNFFTLMLKRVNSMIILGDVWAQAGRDYYNEHLFKDDILGAPRIFLGIQTLYGDPSLRLTPVVSYGVSAVMANNRLTIFARTLHGVLTHRYYDTNLNKWTDWKHFEDGQISSGTSAVMAGDRLTVFARTVHGTLTHKYYDTSLQKWTEWKHLESNSICSTPSAVMSGDRLVVFARDEKGRLTHRYYDPQQQGWTQWITLGDEFISSAPSAVISNNRLVVFAQNTNEELTHKYYDQSQQVWTSWIPLGKGKISSAPSAVMAGNRLTVFARTLHNTLTHKYYDTSLQKWTEWIHLGDGQIS